MAFEVWFASRAAVACADRSSKVVALAPEAANSDRNTKAGTFIGAGSSRTITPLRPSMEALKIKASVASIGDKIIVL